jgi:hypothetical protein
MLLNSLYFGFVRLERSCVVCHARDHVRLDARILFHASEGGGHGSTSGGEITPWKLVYILRALVM